jgi:hypothetical protein
MEVSDQLVKKGVPLSIETVSVISFSTWRRNAWT